MQAKFLFLGSGGSLGIPVVGCTCPVCTSSSPYNFRLRSSGLLRIGERSFIIDAGPDYRYQALKYGIRHLDGVFITHTHYDHIAGVDELRIYYLREKKKIPCLLSEESLKELRVRYHYLLHPKKENVTVSSQFHFHLLKEDFGEAIFEGMKVKYLSYWQAGMKVTGFRWKDFAYITDIHLFTDQVFQSLEGVKILVLSALRWTKSPVHFSLDEAIAFASKIGAEKTYFTHIAHDIDHEETNRKLPNGFQLGYDGLELEIDIDLSEV